MPTADPKIFQCANNTHPQHILSDKWLGRDVYAILINAKIMHHLTSK